MYKNFRKSTKYSSLASFCIIVFLFTFIGNTAYGSTITGVTIIVGELSNPRNLAVDKDGNIYVVETEGSTIKKINMSNNTTTTTAAVGLDGPLGVAIDKNYNTYFASFPTEADYPDSEYPGGYHPIIHKTDIEGNTTTLQMPNELVEFAPFEVAVDSSDNVYGVDGFMKIICKFDSNGKFIKSFDCKAISDNYEDGIYDIKVDSSGNIYVAHDDRNVQNPDMDDKYSIYKLDSNGNFIDIGKGIFDEYSYKHIAVDSSDNVYISDRNKANNTNIIYKMTINGQIEVYASYSSSNTINGIAVDNNGNIYVLEGNHVKQITVSPELKMDTTNPPNGTVGTPYKYTFTSTGGIGTKTYSVTDGSLPTGLTLSEDGILSGTLTTVGTNMFAITATDSATPTVNTSSAAVSLVVSDVPTYTIIYSASDGGNILGQGIQQVKSGGSGSKVTAIPNIGYIFMGWDDGVNTATRTETNVSGYKNVKALFFRPTVTPPPLPPMPLAPPLPSASVTSLYTPPLTSTTDSSPSSTSSPISNTTQILATVTNGGLIGQMPQLPVQISTGADGTRNGNLRINLDNVQKIVDSVKKQGQRTGVINMTYPSGELSSLTLSFEHSAIERLSDDPIDLRFGLLFGGVNISNEAFQKYIGSNNRLAGTGSTADSGSQVDDLYFKFTQIKDPKMQEEINKRASQLLPNSNVQPLSTTLDIQTNMPYGSNVGVRLPIPTNEKISPALDADLLSNTAAYTEHSNGINESQRFDRIEFVNGSPIGVIDKTDFSKFTIVRLSQKTTSEGSWENDEQGWKYIKNGEPVTGWNQIGGSYYLMGSDGSMKTGWEEVDGKWYYLNSDGTMARNTVIDGHILNEDGVSID